jgi:hypothetical protein
MKSTLINSYIQNFKDKRPNGTILIARSNTAVQQSNAFEDSCTNSKTLQMQQGDILLVTQNNYLRFLCLMDFIKILKIETKMQANLNLLMLYCFIGWKKNLKF